MVAGGILFPLVSAALMIFVVVLSWNIQVNFVAIEDHCVNAVL